MTKHYALSAAKRDRAGKGVARALRRENRIPAVIYGDKKPPVTISMPVKEITLELHKGHLFTTLCDMDVDGEKYQLLARDVQVHPVSDAVEHVDFLRVTSKTKLTVSVPVHFSGYEDSAAAREKGVVNTVRHEVDIVCLATAIPESIEVDLSKAEIGDTIKISNAKLPEGAKPAIDDRDFTLATIMAPKRAADIEAEEAADGEAPEAPEGETAEGDAAEGDKAE